MTAQSDLVGVSRETMEKLQRYSDLVLKWTPKINLIAKGTAPEIWERHIEDSAQIYKLAPDGWRRWIDLGSGAGFPGVVVAIIDQENRPVTLVESDQRKALFLKTIKRELGLNLDILTERVESVGVTGFDVVSARAFTSLDALLLHASRLIAQNGIALFPKGRRYADELNQAMLNWDFELEALPSITSPDSRILCISRIKKREP